MHSKSARVKYIYSFICLFLLSGVAQADKWLCGTSKEKTSYFICGTYPNAHPDDWFRQYIYILDEAVKNEDGSGRVMLREVGGKVAFNGDVCSDSTETELSCHVNGHYLSFDKTDYSFYYWHDFDYWLRKEAKRAENQSKSNVVVVDMSRNRFTAKRDFRVSGICTPFVNHETHSNLDFNYEPELSATEHLEVLAKVVTWLDVRSFSRGRDL